MQRYRKTEEKGIKKGNWSQEESELLIALVNRYGTDNWDLISRQIPGRSAAKCRDRYTGYLDPSIKKGYGLMVAILKDSNSDSNSNSIFIVLLW